nr:MAG TPA: hypothetical protein [Bacteriophage sp.]
MCLTFWYTLVKSKDKEQNKKAHRAAIQSYTMSTKQNNMKGAYIITYVGKSVNHEKIKL